jgi:hypothetical protein
MEKEQCLQIQRYQNVDHEVGQRGTDSTMTGELVYGEVHEIGDCLTYFII